MKNTVAILLALLLLAGSTVSCSKPDNNSDNESAGNKTTNTDNEAGISDETELEPTLPETGYGGKDISVHSDNYLFADYPDFYLGENDGDIVKAAAYQRNLSTEERLDVNLVLVEDADYTLFINSVMAGDNSFDIITRCNSEIVGGVIQGCFYDLHTLPYINTDNPWYVPYVNDDMEMLGSLYVACGNYDMATFARTCVTFFSTKIAEEKNRVILPSI